MEYWVAKTHGVEGTPRRHYPISRASSNTESDRSAAHIWKRLGSRRKFVPKFGIRFNMYSARP